MNFLKFILNLKKNILKEFKPKELFNNNKGVIVLQTGPHTGVLYIDTPVTFNGIQWGYINIHNTQIKLQYLSQTHIVPQGETTPVVLTMEKSGLVRISNTLAFNGTGEIYIRATLPLVLA